jgi:hypothetical protein
MVLKQVKRAHPSPSTRRQLLSDAATMLFKGHDRLMSELDEKQLTWLPVMICSSIYLRPDETGQKIRTEVAKILAKKNAGVAIIVMTSLGPTMERSTFATMVKGSDGDVQ